MTRRKTRQAEETYDPWEYYQSIQLTPEQKAEARAEMEQKRQAAVASGAYEEFLSWIGKVHLEYDLDELREDRDLRLWE